MACIEEIERRGMRETGIYRVPGYVVSILLISCNNPPKSYENCRNKKGKFTVQLTEG